MGGRGSGRPSWKASPGTPTGVTAVRSTSTPLEDMYVPCPGNGIMHPELYLPVVQGPKILFAYCGVARCASFWQMRGAGWMSLLKGTGRVGYTRAEIAKKNPNALIL